MRGRTRDRHLSDRRIPARPGRGAVGPGGLDTARRLPVPRRRLPRANAGRASHRTPVAAQPDRLDPPAWSAPPLPPATRRAGRRRRVVVPVGSGDAAAPLRLARRCRARVSDRPPAVATVALGRGGRRRQLRRHDRPEAVRPGAVSAAERRHPQPGTRQRIRPVHRRRRPLDPLRPSGWSRPSSRALSPSSSASADRSGSSVCRCCGSSGARRSSRSSSCSTSS